MISYHYGQNKIKVLYKYPLEMVTKYFQSAIDKNLLRFELKEENDIGKRRLTVELKAPTNYQPSVDGSYKWYLVCARYMEDFPYDKLIENIIMIMADKLSSLQQDLNGIQDDYTLIRK